MKQIVPIYKLLFIFFLLLGCQDQPRTPIEAAAPETAENGYKVVAIKDGDTIEILKDDKPVRVRLYGVDAPEKNQDYGTRARQFTSDLCFGKLVELEVKDTDRYGRTVGVIRLADGRSLNEELVRYGFAWHYKAYSNDPELARLEAEARADRRGLWEKPRPTPPWEFRKNRRANSVNAPATAARPSDAGRTVFICDSKGATTYHVRQDCSVLKRCKRAILDLTRGTAVMNRERTACKICS